MFSQIELEGQAVGLLPNREALGVLKFNCSGGGHHSFPINHHGDGGHCPPVSTHCGDHPAPVHHAPPIPCPPAHPAPVHCPPPVVHHAPVHHAPVHHPVHHAPVHHHPEHGGGHGRTGGDC